MVEETEAREDWPATARVPALWRAVAAVRFVEETFVKTPVAKFAKPVPEMFVEEAFVKTKVGKFTKPVPEREVPLALVKFKVGKVP